VEFADAKSAIAAADIVLLLVNHKKFMTINQKALNQKILIDTRGMWR
jgi:UDP-N-acetyl-D-mannosaminuronic acid dehydrogenase